MTAQNYWVVGAMWDGQEDQIDVFLRRGYWLLGWEDHEQPSQSARRDQIKADDRVAIKRMLGRGSNEIEIRALGIVQEVDKSDGRVYVRWVATEMGRKVPARGCFQSIHGPFANDDAWTRLVFQL